jgi:hypothetical protein
MAYANIQYRTLHPATREIWSQLLGKNTSNESDSLIPQNGMVILPGRA